MQIMLEVVDAAVASKRAPGAKVAIAERAHNALATLGVFDAVVVGESVAVLAKVNPSGTVVIYPDIVVTAFTVVDE